MDWERLSAFYQTPLGKVTRRTLRHGVRSFWPPGMRETLLGVGYPVHALTPYMEDALALHIAVPKRFGASPWPESGPTRVVLVDVHELPFLEGTYEKILLLHGLEFGENFDRLLGECWRVLAPGGRILVGVPNRRGLWSHMDHTPFGWGLPFTVGQLEELLKAYGFTPTQTRYSLLMPPVRSRTLLSLFSRMETFFKGPLRKLSGVILMEAVKQVYAPIPKQGTLVPGVLSLRPV